MPVTKLATLQSFVTDALDDAGFLSAAAFYRWFGKLTGLSPKEYRRG